MDEENQINDKMKTDCVSISRKHILQSRNWNSNFLLFMQMSNFYIKDSRISPLVKIWFISVGWFGRDSPSLCAHPASEMTMCSGSSCLLNKQRLRFDVLTTSYTQSSCEIILLFFYCGNVEVGPVVSWLLNKLSDRGVLLFLFIFPFAVLGNQFPLCNDMN